MANKKISALTSATVPLAGTEILPIVQSSNTTSTSVANLTAGRSVSALNFTSTAGSNFATSSGNVGIGTASPGALLDVAGTTYCHGGAGLYVDNITAYSGTTLNFNAGSTNCATIVNGTTRLDVLANGNANLSSGNIIPQTAAKGINFTANAFAAGKTSQLLNWYEEGTWTPTQGSGLTVIGTFSSSGTYTRIGRLVNIRGVVLATGSVSCTSLGLICAGLPYYPTVDTPGVYFNGSVSAGGAVDAASSGVYAAGVIAASPGIYISATYST